MTKDDIMRMAREAGLHSAVLLRIYDDKEAALCDSEIAELRKIERFSTLVAAAEREACAALAEKTICDKHIPTGVSIYGSRAAKAIRARGSK